MDLITNNDYVNVDWQSKGRDYTVDSWFLMGSPWAVISIWVAYMAFVLKYGPAYMEKRPAFQLRKALIAYNVFQVAFSVYILYMGAEFMYRFGVLTSYCGVDGVATRPEVLNGVYVYLLAKLSELLDTVFFVLRKKMNQVSFLHVYHHSLMMLGTWCALKYNPTDAVIFLGTLNSFVHVIMYGYYGLSAFPSLTKYLWWKIYITTMQLVQFGCIALHVIAGTFVSKCQTPYVLLFVIIFNCGVMVYLFRDFYNKAYSKKSDSVKSKAGLEHNGDTRNVSWYAKNLRT